MQGLNNSFWITVSWLFLFLLLWLFHSWIVPASVFEKVAPHLTTEGIALLTVGLGALLLLLSERRLQASVTRMESADSHMLR